MYVYVMLCFRETSEVLVGLDFEGRRAMLAGSKKLHTFTGTDYPSPCRLMLYRCTYIQIYLRMFLDICIYANIQIQGKKY